MVIVFLFISILIFVSPIEFNASIEGNLEKIFYKEESYIQVIYLIKKLSKNYDFFEVNNFYGQITILKNEEIIGKLDNDENSFYFNHDGISNYYMIFKFPSNFQICGFKVTNNFKEYNYILNNHLSLYFLIKRKFNLIITNNKKENSTSELMSIKISSFLPIRADGIFIDENGKAFKPIFEMKETNGYIYYYVIIKEKLEFNLSLYSIEEQPSLINYVDIFLNNEKIETISDNITACLESKNFKFYKIKNNNSILNNELLLLNNSQLFLIENNYIINSIETKTLQNKSCFSLNDFKINKIESKQNKIFILDSIDSIITINDDYSNCFEKEKEKKIIKLNPNINKKIIRLTTNAEIKLDNITIKDYKIFNLTETKNIEIEVYRKPICISIFYLKKEIFDITLNKEQKYPVASSEETFIFDLKSLKNMNSIISFEAYSTNRIIFANYYEFDWNSRDYNWIETESVQKDKDVLIITVYKRNINELGEFEVHFYIDPILNHKSLYYTSIALCIACFLFMIFYFCCIFDDKNEHSEKYSKTGCCERNFGCFESILFVFCRIKK
jgi:hypothetical protein